ncbi:MAG: putative Ig domain-containing protein, partial [Limisphaerales bacterium]
MILLGIAGLLALRAAADVTLAWDANTEADVVGYRLHFGTTSGSYTQQLDVGNATTGTVGGLDAGRIYFFAATAVNATGAESDFSNEIEYQVPQPNRAPTLEPLGDRTGPEGSELRFVAQAADADLPAQTLQFTLGMGAPGGAVIDSATGEFRWTPTEAQGPGTFPLTIVVTDNGSPRWSASQSFVVTVTEVNAAPVVAAIANRTVGEGSEVSFALSATDADLPAQTLSYAIDSGAPVGASLNASTGLFRWTPTEAQGPSTNVVTFSVTDSAGAKSVGTAMIMVTEVNSAPVLVGVVGQSVTLAWDASPEPEVVGYRLYWGTTSGQYTASVDVGEVTSATISGFDPGAEYYFAATALNDTGTESDYSIEVSHSMPTGMIAGAALTIIEGYELRWIARAEDGDVPSQTIRFSLGAGAPDGASIDAVTGEFRWTPARGQGSASHDIVVVATDDGSPNLSDSLTVRVDVVGVNQAPVLAAIADQTVPEGSELSLALSAADADLPAQTLTYAIDSGAPVGAILDAATGLFRWTPTEAQGPSTNVVTFSVIDSAGAKSVRTTTIMVTEVNAAPVLAAIANRTVKEKVLLSFTLSATDADVPAQKLTFAMAPGAPVGAVLDAATGVFRWTPTEAQGPSTNVVTFSVTDSAGAKATRSATIVASEVNAAPTLAWIYGSTVAEGSLLTFTASAADADLPAQQLTFSLNPGAPTGAVIDPSTGVFRWTPTEAQGPSTNSITVTVTDSYGRTASRTTTIKVTEVNSTPVLAAIGVWTVAEGTELNRSLSGSDADVPAQKLTYAVVAGAPAGAVLDAATGVFRWTPTEAQGPSTNVVTFAVTDSVGAKATRSATIVVSEVNAAPTLAWIYGSTVAEGSLLTFTASAADADLPAQQLTFSLNPGAPTGAVIDPSTGLFRWTPTEDQGPSTN